jgi:hypothetical protein
MDRMFDFASPSALIAVTEIGVFCRSPFVRSAVTTISSSSSDGGDEAAVCAVAGQAVPNINAIVAPLKPMLQYLPTICFPLAIVRPPGRIDWTSFGLLSFVITALRQPLFSDQPVVCRTTHLRPYA